MATRFWSPSRTYEFEVKVADRDLTPDLYKLTILTSIDFPYQTFILEFFLDANDLILEKIYSQNEIKLTAKLMATAPGLVNDQIDFSLMYLSFFSLTSRPSFLRTSMVMSPNRIL